MKKILFLTDSYLPNPSPNGICIVKIMEYLVERGDYVSVIAYSEHNSPKSEKINGINVYRLSRGWINNKISYLNNKDNTKYKMICINFLYKLIKIKQLLMIPIYPWTDLFYTYKLYNKTLKLHKKLKFDVIICVHKPIETLIVGFLIKNKFKSIKFITYFLDSLSGGFNMRILPKEWCIKRKIKWEKYLLNYADLSILMKSSQNHHYKYSRKFPYYSKMHFLDIPLLVEKSNNNVVDKGIFDYNKINIVFAGTLYLSTRNPMYILELFNRLDRNDIALYFIGGSNCRKILNDYNEKFRGEIYYLDHMEHSKIIKILPCADFLLNIGVRNENAISGKIFEYMSFEKPIISTYEIDNESCIPYLKRYEASLLINQNKGFDYNAEILNKFLNIYYGKNISFNKTKKRFYENTPQAFIDILDSNMVDKK